MRTLHSPETRQPDVSIIIPHYDDLHNLNECLKAIDAQEAVDHLKIEVIVADNNSPCGLDEVEAAVGNRGRVVLATTKGAGPARNAGIAAAHGVQLAFTDCDCLPGKTWLANGLAALADHDLVGGRMVVLSAGAGKMSGAEAFERVFAFQNEEYVKNKGFTVTANLLCERATATTIGDFRTQVSEDYEWCQRARTKGFTLGYAAKAVIGHPARKDWPELKKKWQRLNRESYAFALDNGHGKLKWLARTWLLPLSILPHSVRIIQSDELQGFGQRIKAIATLVRLRLWRFGDQQFLMLQKD